MQTISIIGKAHLQLYILLSPVALGLIILSSVLNAAAPVCEGKLNLTSFKRESGEQGEDIGIPRFVTNHILNPTWNSWVANQL